MKHPVRSDFDTAVTEAGVNVTFKPTNSTYSFYRLAESEDIARLGPVSLERVRHAGPRGDTEDYPADEVQEIPAKRRYTFQDTQRWALHLGLEFKSPPAHPFSPLKPLRVTSAVDNDDLREVLAVRLLDAAWSEGRDITSDSVINEVADSIGINGQELLGKAQTVEVKERLRLQTDRAIEAGVFGVPSFVVNGEIFWGNDRLHLLKEYLQGRLPTDKAKVDEILSRPRQADRSRKQQDIDR
jgi:2-hydroxychromene-2-carboxylate isomerase